MSLTALSGLEPVWFEPAQSEDGEKTAFHLKPLTGPEYMHVMSQSRIDGNNIGLTAAGVDLALGFGLIGWRNYSDAKGAPVPFNKNNFARIDAITLLALGNEILDISELSAPQKKT